MHEIETWIENAVRHLNLGVRKLERERAARIRDEAMSRYVKIKDPRVWWANLSRPIAEWRNRKSSTLSSILPEKQGKAWLIPETDQADLPVYEIELNDVESLINDCNGFEYNIVANDLSWLVCETEDDQFYLCRDAPGKTSAPRARPASRQEIKR